MKRRSTGQYRTTSTAGEKVRAFIPDPLPPDPPLKMSREIRDEMDRALIALGRLDSVSVYMPDTNLLLYLYVRKEAVLSSQIEGTQSSLSDLLLYEMEAWLSFFSKAVLLTADQSAETAKRLIRLAEEDRVTVRALGRIAGSAMMVHQSFLQRPLTDSARLCQSTGLVPNTVNKVLKALEDAGLVHEVTGRNRNRVYAYRKFIEVMNEGTEVF